MKHTASTNHETPVDLPTPDHRGDHPYVIDLEPTAFDLAASPFNCLRTTCVRDLQIWRYPRDQDPLNPPSKFDVLLTLNRGDEIVRQVVFWGERTKIGDEPFIAPYKVRAGSRIVLPYNSETQNWADLVCVEENKMSDQLELNVVYIGAITAVEYLARNYEGEYLKINTVRGSWTSPPYHYDYEAANFLSKFPTILSIALLTGYGAPLPGFH